jgi:hypothetical protein
MTPVKLIFICGDGGARADFVAGWLGLQSNFVNSYWNIDPLTGVSVGYMGNLRLVRNVESLYSNLNNFGFELSNKAETHWAVACHDSVFHDNSLTSLVNQGKILVLDIDTTSADLVKIYWEFVVKTYLSKRRSLYNSRHCDFWEIDKMINKENITNEDRIAQVKSMLLQINQPSNSQNFLNKDLNALTLEYSKLFCQGGSKYLNSILKLNVDIIYHNYWDSMLEYANSPTNINVWGYEWKKQNYFGLS